jgi:hypothetical protein
LCRYVLARGPLGLEVGAAKLELDLAAGAVGVKAARLSFAARGGVGCDDDEGKEGVGGGGGGGGGGGFGGVSGDGEDTGVGGGGGGVLEAAADQLAVVPAAEMTLGYAWDTLGGALHVGIKLTHNP